MSFQFAQVIAKKLQVKVLKFTQNSHLKLTKMKCIRKQDKS